MSSSPTGVKRVSSLYTFSTSIPARKADSVITASIYLECRDWAETRRRVVEDNEYQINVESSLKRIANDIIRRLKSLTDEELEFFASSYGDDQDAMLWVALCRTYPFMSGLSRNVIVDRYARTIPDYTDAAFETYFEEEAQYHPELLGLSERSRKNMRRQVYRMLVECRLITEEGRITPLYPSPAFVSAISEDHREDLMLFPGVTLI